MTQGYPLPLEAATQAVAETPEGAFCMDERNFQAFYAQTASRLRAYLARASGNPTLADDLMQETYYRFLRAALPPMTEAHRKNYLFRIGTNLLRDHFRSAKRIHEPLPELPTGERTGHNIRLRSDLERVFQKLNPRERQLLWMAYAEGANHNEIAEVMELKAQSVRALLFRARHKLAEMLRRKGLGPEVLP